MGPITIGEVYYIELDLNLNILHWELHNGDKGNPIKYIPVLDTEGYYQTDKSDGSGYLVALNYDWKEYGQTGAIDLIQSLKKKIKDKEILTNYIDKL